MSPQISCGWQKEMSGILCRRRPRFDYIVSQHTWMKNTNLCQSQNGVWDTETGFLRWLMEKPRNMGISKGVAKQDRRPKIQHILLFLYRQENIELSQGLWQFKLFSARVDKKTFWFIINQKSLKLKVHNKMQSVINVKVNCCSRIKKIILV